MKTFYERTPAEREIIVKAYEFEVEAIEAGMAEKSEEFEAAGGRVYLPLSAE